MTGEIRYWVGGLLVEQIDAFAGAVEGRDQARRWAVHLEQKAHELERQITDAREWIQGMPCECREYLGSDGEPDWATCDRCVLLLYLAPRSDPSEPF